MGKGKNLSSLGRMPHSGKFIPESTGVDNRRYYQLKPSWKFSEAWRGDPKIEKVEFYGYDEIQKQGQYLIEKLAQFEGRRWNEILIIDKKSNHEIAVSALSKEAQRVIQKFLPNMDSIVSLRFSGQERLFGRIEGGTGAFVILFWDPHHKVCLSSLKHT